MQAAVVPTCNGQHQQAKARSILHSSTLAVSNAAPTRRSPSLLVVLSAREGVVVAKFEQGCTRLQQRLAVLACRSAYSNSTTVSSTHSCSSSGSNSSRKTSPVADMARGHSRGKVGQYHYTKYPESFRRTECSGRISYHIYIYIYDSKVIRAGPAKGLPIRLIVHAPLNTTYWDAIFLHGVDHAPTHEWAASSFSFRFSLYCSRDKTDTKIRKNTKATVTCLNKEGARFPFVCICRAKTRFNFQVETRKFGRGITEKQKMVVITCVMYLV